MIKHPDLIQTAQQIQAMVSRLRQAKVIAFDTEFIRETTFYPIVEIIQVATDSESWLVDAQAFKKGFKHGPKGGYHNGIDPLLEVFEDRSILKILHAAQGDQECLYTSFGRLASHTLDTAVAASLIGLGDSLGLGKLLDVMLGVELQKGHARTNWSVRPLPPQLVEYAHADVTHLVKLAEALRVKLEKEDRWQWALSLSAKWEDPKLYEVDLESLTHKLGRGGRLDRKAQAALRELLKWREARVRHLNVPRKWVAEDAVLVDLARVRPKDREHLNAFRGINKGELNRSADALLAALRAAETSDEPAAPRGPKPMIPSTDESQAIDVLKCYLGILADQHRIAARHLHGGANWVALLRNPPRTIDELVARDVMAPEAAALVGKALIALLEGRTALGISGNRIRVIDLKSESKG